jgi:RNA polymerase sigma-70 factor (ECF subfamily)
MAGSMRRDFDERAVWLARKVLPHEMALRSWLKQRRVVGLEIDDIVQETYAKILSLDSIDGILDPRTYTYQIAYSILVSHVRRSRIVSIRATGDIERLGAEAPGPSPERVLADRDELRELAAAITSMPRKTRVVFVLRRVEGLDHKDIANRLGISKKAVEKRMTQGIRHLMTVFGRGGDGTFQASNPRDRLLRSRDDTTEKAGN